MQFLIIGCDLERDCFARNKYDFKCNDMSCVCLLLLVLQELCKGLDGGANSTYLIPNVDL
jgi:hypothetical protein